MCFIAFHYWLLVGNNHAYYTVRENSAEPHLIWKFESICNYQKLFAAYFTCGENGGDHAQTCSIIDIATLSRFPLDKGIEPWNCTWPSCSPYFPKPGWHNKQRKPLPHYRAQMPISEDINWRFIIMTNMQGWCSHRCLKNDRLFYVIAAKTSENPWCLWPHPWKQIFGTQNADNHQRQKNKMLHRRKQINPTLCVT